MSLVRVALFFTSALLCLAIFPFFFFLPEAKRYQSCAFVLQTWSRFVLKIFRIQVLDDPDHQSPKKPHVIIANHVSYLDIPVLMSRSPCLFMAKKEVATWPVIGWIGRLSGMVFVDREKLWDRASALLYLQKRLQSQLNIVIFPEGSTSIEGPRKRWGQFFAGAFRIARMEDAPIEMIYLDYEDIERCAWIGDAEFLQHLTNVYTPEGCRVHLRRSTINDIPSREAQRDAHEYSRQWFLEGGRTLF